MIVVDSSKGGVYARGKAIADQVSNMKNDWDIA